MEFCICLLQQRAVSVVNFLVLILKNLTLTPKSRFRPLLVQNTR